MLLLLHSMLTCYVVLTRSTTSTRSRAAAKGRARSGSAEGLEQAEGSPLLTHPHQARGALAGRAPDHAQQGGHGERLNGAAVLQAPHVPSLEYLLNNCICWLVSPHVLYFEMFFTNSILY